jgi:hypothetical protein
VRDDRDIAEFHVLGPEVKARANGPAAIAAQYSHGYRQGNRLDAEKGLFAQFWRS